MSAREIHRSTSPSLTQIVRCNPNAFLAWNPETKHITLHATRQISEGEEITISYTQSRPYLGRLERNQVLAD